MGRRGRVVLPEEALAPDELCGDGPVHDGKLHAALRPEVVEQLAPSAEDGLLALLARRLVAYVVEGERLAEQPLFHLRDAVLVHEVVAYGRVDVARRAAAGASLGHAVGEPPFLLGHATPKRLGALGAGGGLHEGSLPAFFARVP